MRKNSAARAGPIFQSRENASSPPRDCRRRCRTAHPESRKSCGSGARRWAMEDDVARAQRLSFADGAHGRLAAEQVVKFPLRGVGVERATGLAWREHLQLQIERMSSEADRRVALRTERDGEILTPAAEYFLRRDKLFPYERVGMEFSLCKRRHGSSRCRRRDFDTRITRWRQRILAVEVLGLDHPEKFTPWPQAPFI